jgi:hypothetical protein
VLPMGGRGPPQGVGQFAHGRETRGDGYTRPGSRSVISWSIQRFPSGSRKEANDE